MTGKNLAVYDPKVESAALMLLEKAAKDLGRVTTIREATDVRTFAKAARERALSIPTFNKASAVILAAEVVLGQMLLKERAPAKGGQPYQKTSTPVVETGVEPVPTLQEVLGKHTANAATSLARRLRKWASSITAEQIHQAAALLTNYNEVITRKAVKEVAQDTWAPKKKAAKTTGKSTRSTTAPTNTPDTNRSRANRAEQYWAEAERVFTQLTGVLMTLQTNGVPVAKELAAARQVEGIIRSVRTAK